MGLEFRNSDLQGTSLNQSINFYPTGTGKVVVGQVGTEKNVAVNGDVHTTGTLTFNGDVTFGNTNADNVSFASDIASSIRPEQPSTTELWSLGQPGYTWNNLYSKNVNVSAAYAGPNLYEGSINLGLRQGKSWYVSINGANTNDGNHQQGPFLTIAKALSVATNGDTIFVFPGTYTEITPLTVPVGVTVRGLDIRTVVVQPDPTTISNDVFLLNGETTLEDFTVTGHRYNNLIDTGYAFRFANNFTVTSRSPYVKNITIITSGSVTTSDDPRGYLAGDAGRGALVDGNVANVNSKEASMLFHSITCICPGTETIVMRSGVRVEWLNSFTYFAEKGFYATQGLGRVTPEIVVPSEIIDGGEFATSSYSDILDGGSATSTFESSTDTGGATSYVLKYGAELRSINSANVYGDWAAYGDGADVIMYLIGHNFAYVGSLQDISNDPTLANEGHEAERLNGAEIYYQSVDQSGNMRVGNVFKVNGETGAITFTGINFQINQGSIEFVSSTSRTYIDAHEVSTGNIRISDNTITTISDGLTISAANQVVDFSSISDFILPKGTNTDSFNTVAGIRFNTTINNFEGYAATGRVSLYAIEDSTKTTRITPELTPGADDKTIRMYSNNDLKITITNSLVSIKNLNIGDLRFDTTNVMKIYDTHDLTLVPSSGNVNIQKIQIYENTIENTADNDVMIFPQNSDGYFVFGGQKALEIPHGTNAEKTVAEIGMHRYNTETQEVEVYNGTVWASVAGGGSTISSEAMLEVSELWAFVLG